MSRPLEFLLFYLVSIVQNVSMLLQQKKKKTLISGEEKPRPESLLFCILVVLFGICLKIRKYEPLRFLFEQI
jgi:hypothetical protein